MLALHRAEGEEVVCQTRDGQQLVFRQMGFGGIALQTADGLISIKDLGQGRIGFNAPNSVKVLRRELVGTLPHRPRLPRAS